ncbi:MAG: DUF4350 domain-containing protein [Candidatus Cyclobacteriaceae bacterium M3_2C_046]
MKKDLKYIIFLVATFVIFLVIEYNSPQPIDWRVSLQRNDKIPYGTVVLAKLLPQLFDQEQVKYTNNTLSDLFRQDQLAQNILILAENLNLGEQDSEALLKLTEAGKNIFLISGSFYGPFSDHLNIKTGYYLEEQLGVSQSDSGSVRFTNPQFDPNLFRFSDTHLSVYFSSYDTAKTRILAVNQENQPVFIQVMQENGSVFLSTLPLLFTNYNMLAGQNHRFISHSLSYLPAKDLVWTNYYQVGRLESSSPIRFILSNPSLKWAYFITLFSLILFLLFESRRKQRAIPVIQPPVNATLDFIHTMGNLYMKKASHKNIAEKKITYFLDYIRNTYFVRTDTIDQDFYHRLSQKTSKTEEELKKFFDYIHDLQQQKRVSARELTQLNQKIQNFKKQPDGSREYI